MLTIRPLRLTDLAAADEVTISAFQCPSRRVEIERWMSLEGTTWLGGEESGRLVAMVGAIDYGPFAYIGLMGVHADFQRCGYGRAIMITLIERLEQAGQLCTLLDASEAGAPLYARIGYQDLSLSHVFRWNGNSPAIPLPERLERLELAHLPEIVTLDQPFFGANRSNVLRSHLTVYPGRILGVRNLRGELLGYVIAQISRIGPWIAVNEESAAALLGAALKLEFEDSPTVILPSSNRAGIELLKAFGFELQRSLRHMGRGCAGSSRCLEYIYSQSSFMLG
jgi:GNAT superfamily N-acetyltransferase